VYQIYCPFVPPETESVTLPAPHELPLTGELGAAGVTQKLLELVAVFDPTLTVIVPVVAAVGTVVIILVAEFDINIAGAPLNFTELLEGVRSKFVPVMVTVVPMGPLVGVKLEMVGIDPVTVKFVLLVAVFPPTVTAIGPVVAPAGTVVVMLVVVLAVTTALVPLNVKMLLAGVVPSKPVPTMVTVVPTAPLIGEKLVIVVVCPKSDNALDHKPWS
jgi:hypothetical protein